LLEDFRRWNLRYARCVIGGKRERRRVYGIVERVVRLAERKYYELANLN
jgi:hypothetical protein